MKKIKKSIAIFLATTLILSSCNTKNNDDSNKNNSNIDFSTITDDDKVVNEIYTFNGDIETISSENVEKFNGTFFAMDTINNITLYVENKEESNKYLKLAEATVNEYEEVLSKTIEGSFTYELNKNKTYDLSNHPYKSQILYILGKSIFYNELSKGNFDITIEPLVDIWGFGTNKQGYVPTDKEIQSILEKVNSDYINVNGDVVTLKNDATIDFGAIAKGYIGDKTKEVLQDAGLKSALLNLGGNIVTIGYKPDGAVWKVGVQDPNSQRGELLGVVATVNNNVVTSGIYERNFIVDDTVYHHIIDPKTGVPTKTDISAAVIISDASIDGDALATAIVVLGVEEGMNLIESLDNVDGIIIKKNLEKVFSTGFVEKYNYTDIQQ